jgi:hypothetical protein
MTNLGRLFHQEMGIAGDEKKVPVTLCGFIKLTRGMA